MTRATKIGLAISDLGVAGILLLGACGDPGTAPSMTGRPTDTVSTATAQRTYLVWLDGSLTRLGVSPTGDTTLGAPTVQVIDYRHRGVANVTVNFAVVSGGGTLANAQVVSAANGIARAGVWRLGPAAGPNVVRATSPSNKDTVYFSVDAVDVDTSRVDGRFVLDRVDSKPLPTMMPWGDLFGSELVSAAVEIRGSRFVLTLDYRWPGDAQAFAQRIEGGVERRGPYRIFVMDGLPRADASVECPALMLADGRLRIANYVEEWPVGGRFQDFKRAP